MAQTATEDLRVDSLATVPPKPLYRDSNRGKKDRNFPNERICLRRQKKQSPKKIANLRTTFRKEYKKVESSKVSGAGAPDIIVPKVWYFEDPMFLRDQDTVRKARSNVEEETTQPLLEDFDAEFETQVRIASPRG
ncbi:hypothetical protein PoB_005729900 [Plakobranchus ocellatus]|uniref:Uncharacterized protein n=1 Tax=Plakobranchus ocellatus TaxID=259542 RepID=A0AAV4CIW6_9GAST|nr:hypothetical protein PoB_005729900 [Plakobranchus ocellatus]